MIVAAVVCVLVALAGMQEASAAPDLKEIVHDLNEIRGSTDPEAANMIELVIVL